MHWLRAAVLLLTVLQAAALEHTGSIRTDAAQADRVVELPGAKAEDLTFDLFSGYAHHGANVAIQCLHNCYGAQFAPHVDTVP